MSYYDRSILDTTVTTPVIDTVIYEKRLILSDSDCDIQYNQKSPFISVTVEPVEIEDEIAFEIKEGYEDISVVNNPDNPSEYKIALNSYKTDYDEFTLKFYLKDRPDISAECKFNVIPYPKVGLTDRDDAQSCIKNITINKGSEFIAYPYKDKKVIYPTAAQENGTDIIIENCNGIVKVDNDAFIKKITGVNYGKTVLEVGDAVTIEKDPSYIEVYVIPVSIRTNYGYDNMPVFDLTDSAFDNSMIPEVFTEDGTPIDNKYITVSSDSEYIKTEGNRFTVISGTNGYFDLAKINVIVSDSDFTAGKEYKTSFYVQVRKDIPERNTQTGQNGPAIIKNNTKTTIKAVKAGTRYKLSWKKKNGVNGYEIAYSISKKFSKNKTKIFRVKQSAKNYKKVNPLKKGKNHYVRVRTYKTKNGKLIYSAWSKVVKIR